MPHAIWNGSVSFGLVTVPVSLHAAEERNDLTFKLLDSRNMAPVKQERVNSVTGDPVPWEEVVKGYEYETGRYVVVTDEDFRAADVEATQTIDVLAMVHAETIPLTYYDKPYYLVPATKAARKPYALLRAALVDSGYVGVASVVIRTRQHLAALVVRGDALVLDLLRWPHELRGTDGLDIPGTDLDELGVTDKEVALAGQLVDALATEWEPERYVDTYRQRLLALIERKVETGTVEAPPEPAERPEQPGELVDMTELLKRSLEKASADAKGA